MGTTREIPIGEPFELAQETVGLERTTGRAWFMDWGSGALLASTATRSVHLGSTVSLLTPEKCIPMPTSCSI
jgi:hypothetical protein